MTVEASAWAIEVAVGDPLAKLMLIALSDWSVPGQRCRAFVARLVAQTEIEPDEILERLAMLHRRGYLTFLRVDPGGLSFEYALPDSEIMQGARSDLLSRLEML